MDDVTKIVEASSWEPHERNGKVEIGVNYWNAASGRMTFDSVVPQRYLELWDKGLLKHQQEHKPKPDHLPGREEVAAFLQKERSAHEKEPVSHKPAPVTSAIPVAKRPEKVSPEKHTTLTSEQVVARLQMLKKMEQRRVEERAQRKPPQPACAEADTGEPKPKPVRRVCYRMRKKAPAPLEVLMPWQIDSSVIDGCAKKVPALSKRCKEIMRAALAGQKSIPGLTEASFSVKFGDVCNKLGIPKTRDRFGGFSRRSILSQVVSRYEQLVAEGVLPEAIRTAREIDREFRALLKEKTSAEKELILHYARSLKAGG